MWFTRWLATYSISEGGSSVGSPGHRRACGSPTPRPNFWKRQLTRVILPTVGVGALAVAGAAVVTSSVPAEAGATSTTAPALERPTVSAAEVSRSGERPPVDPVAAAQAPVVGTWFVVADTAVLSDAVPDAAVLATAPEGTTVEVTGVVEGDFTQIVHNGLPRWVASGAVSAEEPVPEPPPLGTAPCASGSGVESGLRPDTVKVHRAVCGAFPSITTYGGLRGDGTHAQGRALDIMVSGALGDEVAAYLQANAAELGITELIWKQRIWTTQRAGDGWRSMSDRGSPTANHYDHVHVTTR